MWHRGGGSGVSQQCYNVGYLGDFLLHNQKPGLSETGQNHGCSEGRRDCDGDGKVSAGWLLPPSLPPRYKQENCRGNPRALIAKGEALYAIGNFEIALVNFERAGKLRQSQDITEGLKKCREAILLTLGKQSDKGRMEKNLNILKHLEP